MIVVLAPARHAYELPDLGKDVRVVAYANLAEAIGALPDGAVPAVIWSDGLFEDDPTEIAPLVRARAAATIEVRADRWDGRTPSHLSAACRGVISGFGVDGVKRAVELLRSEG
jgi:3-dehydroquinate dehydratase